MSRGYVFLERERGADFWYLDATIERCRKRAPARFVAHYSIWGKFDVLAIVEGDGEGAIHDAVIDLRREATETLGSYISDSCTFIAADPAPITKWPDRATLLAIDTVLGSERAVRDSLREADAVHVADMLLGDHDVIALVNAGLAPDAYLEFMAHTVEKVEGIKKTRTMFSFSRPREYRGTRNLKSRPAPPEASE
ncbi:MAG TPA: hypothetical protein PKC43_04650 [Phycisphaerales bacterium]|nr:hypothetical protein [Phycisphaerales bacterium]HMP36717.1 hypothetical protein [Phycisphaerales bacterium]